jgi:allophanate hydrolase
MDRDRLSRPAMTSPETLPFGFAAIREAAAAGTSAETIALEAYRRAEALSKDGVFTALVPRDRVLGVARALDQKAAAGADLPLLGLPFAVKDNIHIEGLATTCNCPVFSIQPQETAAAVQKLETAGAILIGKNTMDQFATGLNGTRSPEPLCRNAIDPRYIPGGSSSGSAVAVARDVVAFSLGSDTGGSGRVPAACNGIVGAKPTLGLVSNRGVVFNSRFFDCMPVFAKRCDEAYEILGHIAGYDALDPYSRPDADAISLVPIPAEPATLAVIEPAQMKFFGDDASRDAYERNLETLRSLGHRLQPMDFGLFEEAGRLVFQSAMVAERLIDYGSIFAAQPGAIHPAVRAAIEAGLKYKATDAFETLYAMKRLQRQARIALAGCTALVVPTVPTIFTIDAMLEEPMARNTIMGTYTYFVNPLDLCAVAVPGQQRADGLPSSLCFIARDGEDACVRMLATGFEAAVLG